MRGSLNMCRRRRVAEGIKQQHAHPHQAVRAMRKGRLDFVFTKINAGGGVEQKTEVH